MSSQNVLERIVTDFTSAIKGFSVLPGTVQNTFTNTSKAATTLNDTTLPKFNETLDNIQSLIPTLRIVFYLLIALLIVSIIVLLVNLFRHRPPAPTSTVTATKTVEATQ